MLINGLGMLVKCNPADIASLYLSGFSLLLVNIRELLRDPTQAWDPVYKRQWPFHVL